MVVQQSRFSRVRLSLWDLLLTVKIHCVNSFCIPPLNSLSYLIFLRLKWRQLVWTNFRLMQEIQAWRYILACFPTQSQNVVNHRVSFVINVNSYYKMQYNAVKCSIMRHKRTWQPIRGIKPSTVVNSCGAFIIPFNVDDKLWNCDIIWRKGKKKFPCITTLVSLGSQRDAYLDYWSQLNPTAVVLMVLLYKHRLSFLYLTEISSLIDFRKMETLLLAEFKTRWCLQHELALSYQR